MGNELKIFIKCTALSFFISTATVNAQILKDTSTLNLIKKGVDSIYNMQFKYSEEVYSKINKLYPEHPLILLYKGTMTYWENYPLLPSSPASVPFEEELHKCIALSEKNSSPSNEAEYLLANLCARGLLIQYYANNGLDKDVFPLATTTYRFIKRSFDFTSIYSDFFCFTGLYNYYREVYPEAHPAYKPLLFLFRKGNRAKGLNELQTAANGSILLKAEAFSDLAYIYINYENNYQAATNFSKYLHNLYPYNPEYLAEYIKNLLLVKSYVEAEKLIISSGSHEGNPYYQAQLNIFEGIIQEKKYRDNKLAQQYYNKGVRDINLFGAYGNEFAAYAYFGLGRISEISGDKESRKIYHKQAMRLADSKKITFD
ncbi:MAG TPA: hypothetical protein VIK07_10905 [Bacteroidales bacterium]